MEEKGCINNRNCGEKEIVSWKILRSWENINNERPKNERKKTIELEQRGYYQLWKLKRNGDCIL